MKVYTVLNNGIVPMIYGVHEWDSEGRPVREIILKNSLPLQQGISQMNININSVAAIDQNDNEYKVVDFENGKSLTLNGIPSGRHLISKSIPKLGIGIYSKLRFYLVPAHGAFIHTDKSESPITGLDFLEFDIEDNLEISGNESDHFILRFDFPPFQKFGVFKQLNQFFRKMRPSSKLRESFGT